MEKRKVRIESGELQGIFGYDPRITVFKGVPYAAPPVGKLRWRAPQPVEPWEGVRLAAEYGPMGIQDVPGLDPNDFWTRELHPAGPEFEMSEDCLYLNVYTPAKKGDEKLPVLMYIHGGGLYGGYPYEIEFDWEHMARKGIVVVTIAYRLGVNGFLSHPWFKEEAPTESVGNYGHMDQLCALQWVKRNIEAFGGDPDKITVAGQSAGSQSVMTMLTTPGARGLFQNAIIQSGIILPFDDINRPARNLPVEEAMAKGAEFFEKAGIKSLEEARAYDAVELHELAKSMGYRFVPPVDNIFLEESTIAAMQNGNWSAKNIMFGFNTNEVSSFNQIGGKLPATMADLMEVAERYGDKKDEFLKLANCQSDEDVVKLMETPDFLTLRITAGLAGEMLSAQGHNTYLYEFNCEIPGEDNPGSYHGSELPFAYDALSRMWRPFTGKSYDMARIVNSYWVNFVKNGDPNGVTNFGEELPTWEACKADKVGKMYFTDHAEMVDVEVTPLMRMRLANNK